MAALTSGARSCSVQCPQPGSIIVGRTLGTIADCSVMNWEKRAAAKIPVAGHVERRNGHLHSDKGSQQFPAAIDIAPPVQGAAELIRQARFGSDWRVRSLLQEQSLLAGLTRSAYVRFSALPARS
jgi:hypothetical protein